MRNLLALSVLIALAAASAPGALAQSSCGLTASPDSVCGSDTVTVAWTAPPGSANTDWIGMYKVGDPDTAYSWWTYTDGAETGSATVTAPKSVGQYEFRYFLVNGYTRAATSNSYQVVPDTGTFSLS